MVCIGADGGRRIDGDDGGGGRPTGDEVEDREDAYAYQKVKEHLERVSRSAWRTPAGIEDVSRLAERDCRCHSREDQAEKTRLAVVKDRTNPTSLCLRKFPPMRVVPCQYESTGCRPAKAC